MAARPPVYRHPRQATEAPGRRRARSPCGPVILRPRRWAQGATAGPPWVVTLFSCAPWFRVQNHGWNIQGRMKMASRPRRPEPATGGTVFLSIFSILKRCLVTFYRLNITIFRTASATHRLAGRRGGRREAEGDGRALRLRGRRRLACLIRCAQRARWAAGVVANTRITLDHGRAPPNAAGAAGIVRLPGCGPPPSPWPCRSQAPLRRGSAGSHQCGAWGPDDSVHGTRGPHSHVALPLSVAIGMIHINENGVRKEDSMPPSWRMARTRARCDARAHREARFFRGPAGGHRLHRPICGEGCATHRRRALTLRALRKGAGAWGCRCASSASLVHVVGGARGFGALMPKPLSPRRIVTTSSPPPVAAASASSASNAAVSSTKSASAAVPVLKHPAGQTCRTRDRAKG
jgi:hypothetical protein